MKKGASTAIVMILVMLITISLILMSYQWLLKYSPQTQQELEKNLLQKNGCLIIENINTNTKQITVRNCGDNDLSNFIVYLDAEPIATYSGTLNSGGITQISYNRDINFGNHEIFVSSNYAETPKIIFSISLPYLPCNYPSFGNWNINTNVVCSNQLIIINGNITIQNGGSLTFYNVTLKFNSTHSLEYGMNVTSGGKMFIYDNDNQKTTTNDAPNITNGPYNISAHYFFQVQSGSQFEMKNSFMSQAGDPLNGFNGWTDFVGIKIKTDNSVIVNNTFDSNYRAISLNGEKNCLISGNIIKNSDIGVLITNYPNLDQYNIVSDNTFINNNHNIHTCNGAKSNIITRNNITGGTCGIYVHWGMEGGSNPTSYNNYTYNNITSTQYGIYVIETVHDNLFANSSVMNSAQYDYYLANATTNNSFINMNFTSARNIYFNDTISWFNYANDTSGLWLKTNVSAASTITRKLVNWNQNLMQWNDTFSNTSGSIIARYNVTGLLTNTNYSVYNNSFPTYTINSSSSGQISFTINLPANQEHEIKVQALYAISPLWFSNSTNNTVAGQPTLFSLYWTDNIGLSGYIFSTNNSGTWQNDAWKPFGITRIQGNARGTTITGSLLKVTLASPPSEGNVLILTLGSYTDYWIDPSISAVNQTNVSWSKIVQVLGYTGGGFYLLNSEIWLGVVGSEASNSINVTLKGGADYGAVADVSEYAGVATTSSLDQTAVGFVSSPPNSGTIALTSQANELWIASTAATNAQTNPTNGFTLLDGASGGNIVSEAYLEKIVSSTGTANTSTSCAGCMAGLGCIATFKASAPTSTAAWSNVTKILNPTPNTLVQWCVYANNTLGNWNSTSCVNPFSLTTISAAPQYFQNSTNSTIAGQPTLFSLNWTDDVGLSGYIFRTNNNGAWVNDTWRDFENQTGNSIFIDGFESGDFSAWSGTRYGSGGSVPAVQSSVVNTGGYAAKYTLAGAGAFSGAHKVLGASYTLLYMRCYTRFNATPTVDTDHLELCDDIGTAGDAQDLVVAVIYNNAGTLKWGMYYANNSAPYNLLYTSNGPAIAMNMWYEVEVMVKIGSGNGEVAMWVNGVQVIDQTGISNDYYVASEAYTDAYDKFGIPVDVYTDNVVVSTSYIGLYTGWSNITKTLNSTSGTNVQWCVYANDTSSPTNWNSTSCINPFSLVTTPANWLSGWSYRKQHNITNAAGADVNYTVQIIVVNGTSADSGNTVYINNKARSDFGDIRFTNSTGSLLNYWIETLNNGANATFWVKDTDNLTSGNSTIYIYYGNSAATNISNGTSAFSIWFDDFSINTISNYTVDGGTWSIDTAHGWLNQSKTSSGYYQIFPTSVNVANSSLLTRIFTHSSTYDCGTALRAASGSKAEFFQDSGSANPHVWDIQEKTPAETQLSKTSYSVLHNSQWHRFRTEMNNNSMWYYWDDNLEVTYTGTFSLSSGSSGLMTYGGGGVWSFDYLAVRKFVYPEPSHGAWRSEESGS